jgi:predicted nucleotidyltransferase
MKSPNFDKLLEMATLDADVLAVVIFGSYARKESYRDIDVCLFLNPDKTAVAFNKMLYYGGNLPDIFDINVFSLLPIYIQAAVMNDGIILLNKNYERLCDIYENAIKEWMAYKPHWDVYLGVD